MKVIILSKTDYKEKDVIINAISEEELLSFKVRGALDPKSPFAWINNPLTVCDVEFTGPSTYKYRILKNALMEFSPLEFSGNTQKFMALNLIQEATIKCLFENEGSLLYQDILNFIEELKKEDVDIYTNCLIFLLKVAKYSGYALNVSGCVNCGSKKDIVAFKFSEGGYLCRNCLLEGTLSDLSLNQMKMIRFVNNAPNFSYKPNFDISELEKKDLLDKIGRFFSEIGDTHLEGISLLTK